MIKREYIKLWRRNNPEKAKAIAARAQHKAAERTRTIVRKLKSVPCMDCGQRYPYYVMDFDHREDKEFTISKRRAYSIEKLLAEIAKCDVVCSNCHRIRTFNRNQSGWIA